MYYSVTYVKSGYFRTTCFDGHINYNLIFFSLTEDFERMLKAALQNVEFCGRGGVTEVSFLNIRLKPLE